MRLAWQMGELDVEAMLDKIDRAKFNRWLVAYYELRLDGSPNAAMIAAAIHNELMPLHIQAGNEDWKYQTPDDHLPPVEFAVKQKQPAEPAEPDWADLAARAWGSKHDGDR